VGVPDAEENGKWRSVDDRTEVDKRTTKTLRITVVLRT